MHYWLKTPEVFFMPDVKTNLKITILVTARNEEKYIEKCLLSIINQNYNKTNFEIIVLDDFSNDNTTKLVSKYKQIKLLKLSDFFAKEFKSKSNKKRAITLGVDHAKYDIIITVDADCFYKKKWLVSFAQHYEKTASKLITAPIDFKTRDTFFSKFLELDLASLMGITCATIQNNKPTMVNGANMLFEKKVFLEVGAYQGNENIASGDDVFLMQKINKKYANSISFLKNHESIASTHSPEKFKDFVNQRIRWTSKSVRFADLHVKTNLMLNYIFYFFLFMNLFVFSFINKYFLFFGLTMLLFKIIIDYFFFIVTLRFFKKPKIINYLIIIELSHIIYITLLGFLSLYGKYNWKGRKL